MVQVEKSIFISYRHSVAPMMACAIAQNLHAHGYDLFIDTNPLNTDNFETATLNQIATRAHFLTLVTHGTLEGCANQGDRLRREIEQALRLERNIILVFVNDFSLGPDAKNLLTGRLSMLPYYQGITLNHPQFDSTMEKLRTRFLTKQLIVYTSPTPAEDAPIVSQKLATFAALPPITADDLLAEAYFNQAYQKSLAGDGLGAIADCTRAIEIKPDYALAYNNRGIDHEANGDRQEALRDYTRAIELNPDYADAYFNRGLIYEAEKNFRAAIADFQCYLDLGGGYQYNDQAKTEAMIYKLQALL